MISYHAIFSSNSFIGFIKQTPERLRKNFENLGSNLKDKLSGWYDRLKKGDVTVFIDVLAAVTDPAGFVDGLSKNPAVPDVLVQALSIQIPKLGKSG